MSVSYQALKHLKPASLHQASTALSAAVTKLATEHTQYKTRVVSPLKAGRVWHGGGQPDAAAVAEINGLAIDTTRLRAAAGAAAYAYTFAGFTLAQLYLTALEKKIKADKLRITELGSVVDDHDPNSSQRTRCQTQLQRILDFATTVEGHGSHTLDANYGPPVTSLANRPGLLDQARADNAQAADDARRAVGLLRKLGDDAATDLPDLKEELFQGLSLPSYSVQAPLGSPASTVVGAFFIALGIRMGVGGAGLALESGGTLSPEAAIAVTGGAILAEVGILLVRSSGVDPSQLQISRTNDGSGSDNGSSQKLDGLLQQAKKLEDQAKPDYGGQGVDDFQAPKVHVDRHGNLTNGEYTLNDKMARHTTGDLSSGKSQFLHKVDSDKAVLDAAAYADKHNLWGGPSGNTAKVYVRNQDVGVTGDGKLTHWINVYRTASNTVHGCPGNPP